MRIYAVADIHGKQQNIAVIYQVIDQFRPDLIVAPGDLTHFFNWQTGLSQLDSLRFPCWPSGGIQISGRLSPG